MKRLVLFALCLLPTSTMVLGADSPSYSKQVQPFLNKYCIECHPAKTPDGGFRVDTYKNLMKGGEHGPALVAGKPDQSKMVRMMDKTARPTMPPKGSPQPTADEIKLIRQWIMDGAKDDGGSSKITLPEIAPRQPVHPPITAVCYLGDGKTIATTGRDEVLILDVASGKISAKIGAQSGKVTALAVSRDGKLLAAASGKASQVGEVRLYRVDGTKFELVHTLTGHKDLIADLSFSPDGTRLTSGSYDRLVKVWSTATGKLERDLKDHSDSVYGVVFSPDGRLIASVAADRAVKVWDVATGVRLYTLSEPTDWVYTVAWHPNGKQLAAAGIDKSIRVWEIDRDGGKILHSVFAHEAAVWRIAYSDDGKTLYSLSEDGGLKSWDTVKMVEHKVYDKQSDVPLSLAVRPGHQQLAVGRYDGKLLLLNEATGKIEGEPLPTKQIEKTSGEEQEDKQGALPVLKKLKTMAVQRGVKAMVEVEADNADKAELIVSIPGTTVKGLDTGRYEVTVPKTVPAGVYPLKLKTAAGESASQSLIVDLFAVTAEVEPNDSPRGGQSLTTPASVSGTIDRPGAVDYFTFNASNGDDLGVQVLTTPLGSKLEAVLTLTDAEGKVVAEGTGLLGHRCRGGRYSLGIRDREYRGDPTMTYRVHIGPVPVVTSVWPMGGQRGKMANIGYIGVNLGSLTNESVKVPADAVVGSRLPLPVKLPSGELALGAPSIVVGEYPDVMAQLDQVGELKIDSTGNGRLASPGATETWKFTAKKGERLIVEVHGRRIGSPLDSVIEILDAKGTPVPQAVLRSTARTYTTFRDHDSFGGGIRIEAWTELAMNDYLYCGTELLRIQALPRNPDDDCRFVMRGGRRAGFYGTTPSQHPLGEPMYKVSIHPPGTTFPPNGFPVVNLNYVNDDGGQGMDKDSRISFVPPSDGEYQLRIRDARGQGGADYSYRLTVRKPRPDFSVSFNPQSPNVWKGGAVPVTVTVERKDEFEGEIALQWDNLPKGFGAPASNIPASDENTVVAFFTEKDAVSPTQKTPLKLKATAMIDGKPRTVEAVGQLPKLADAGEISTTTEQSEITVKPGGEVKLTVKIERNDPKFNGRVPLEVQGLPHGVRVLDIGLNGILVLPGQKSRTVTIYCEPWVKEMEHPIVVLAKREGKNTDHAARPVLLKISR